jgi:alpha-L-fucosidase
VLVAKHHDGVLLWPSATPNPNKPRWGSERDLVGDLASAVRQRDLRFGTYYSGGLDWSFGGLPMRDFQAMLDAIPQTDEYVAYVEAHWNEIIDRYAPDVLWADIGSPAALDLPALFERYYAAVPDGVINNRFDWMRQSVGQVHCDFVTPEYSTKGDASRKWETCRGIGTSFGYNREEDESSYLSPDALVRMFVDVVAHGGNLLLNVGPNADGTIPWVQAQRLLALGWWLRTNGDAIYGTRPWVRRDGTTAEGHDIRYTTRDGAVFAIVCGTPGRAGVELDVTPADGATVHLLGHDTERPWTPTASGCEVTLPARPADAPAFALRLSEVAP